MEQQKIDRINQLARKAKDTGLTLDEATEQASLRTEFRNAVRGNLEAQLDCVYLMDEHGNPKKLEKK